MKHPTRSRIASCEGVPPLNPGPMGSIASPLEPADQEGFRPLLDTTRKGAPPFQTLPGGEFCLPLDPTTMGLSRRLGATTKGAPLDTL